MFVAAGIVLTIYGNPIQRPLAREAPTQRFTVRQTYDLLWEVNKFRRINGLPDLRLSPRLNHSAQWMARDLSLRGLVTHVDSKGGNAATRAQRFGYENFWTIRENVAGGHSTPARVVEAWKQSEGHRKNMLARGVTEVGIGYAYDTRSHHQFYWVLNMSDATRSTVNKLNSKSD